MYYWRTQQGAELDLYVELSGRRIGFEIERTSTPRPTPSMRSALADLGLDHLVVVYPGAHRFHLADKVTAIPASDILTVGNTQELPSTLPDCQREARQHLRSSRMTRLLLQGRDAPIRRPTR